MVNIMDIMQLCRLCLVKDQVNIPIFEEQGDVRQIFLKITACLPVKVSRDDNLPKKICDGCLYKLELLYQFWNTTANAEKQLLSWLSQAGIEPNTKTTDKAMEIVAQSHAHPHSDNVENQIILKQESIDPDLRNDNVNDSLTLETNYVMQQQQLPYESFTFEQSGYEAETSLTETSALIENEVEDEPAPKRRRRAVKAVPIATQESDDENVDDVETMQITKTEEESEEEVMDESIESTSFVGISNTDNEQPGPSGVGKTSTEAPFVNHPPVLRLLHDQSETVEFCPIQPRHKNIQNETIKLEEDPLDTRKYETHVFIKNIRKKYDTNIKTKLGTIPAKSTKTKMVLKKGRRKKTPVANKLVENTKENKEEIEEIKDDIKEENTKIKKEAENVDYQEYQFNNFKKPSIETFDPELQGLLKDEDNNVTKNESVHCDVCNETFKDSVAFGLHSIVHSDDNKYSCHMCDYKNVSKYHFEMHIRAHEGSTKYKCSICNKAFTVSTHAIEHKNFHTGEKPFQCEICGKYFMFSWFLTSHRRAQHWEIVTGMPLVKYDCSICNKHYTSATGLKRHKLSKHNDGNVDPSVLCDICGKRLSNKEKLKFHRRTHTGYKPFTCTTCSKSFTTKRQLKEHERVHTGEKPYICKFCGKGFTQRSPLKIHERIHTGERPYICHLCNKGFISKSVLDTHMKSCNG